MQILNHLTRTETPNGAAFYLDELCNAGRITHYTEYISLVRSQRLAFFQVIQDFGQLRREYGPDGADTILANSNTKIFLPGVGYKEAKYASDLLGDRTQETRSYSYQRGGYNGRQNVSYTRRRLMTSDEIRRMQRGNCLIVSSNVAPIKAKFTPYFRSRRHTRLANLPIATPPNQETSA
jgi:type IV secretion system protein VirD4